MTHSSLIQEAVQSLEPLEAEVLETAMLHFGRRPFQWHELENAGNPLRTPAEYKFGLFCLMRKGLILAVRSSRQPVCYRISFDAFPPLQERIMPGLDDGALPDGAEKTETVYPARARMADNLFKLLVYAAKNGIALTRDHRIHKRDMQKLSASFQWLDPAFAPGDPGTAEGDPAAAEKEAAPFDFAAVYDLALQWHLISEANGKAALNGPQAASWLSLPTDRLLWSLYAFWREKMEPAEVWMLHAVYGCERISPRRWFPVKEVEKWLRGHCGPVLSASSADDIAEHLLSRWLIPLTLLGVAGVGKGADGEWRFRWELDIRQRDGEPVGGTDAGMLTVLPDMEIIALPETPFSLRWELECVAEHICTDVISHYRLTPASLSFAGKQGRRAEGIVSFLSRHSAGGLPANVEQAVRDWAGARPDSDANPTYPDLAAFGFSASPPFQTPRQEPETVRIEGMRPMDEWLYPNKRDLPFNWLKEMRSYHASTARQLLERAIQLKTHIEWLRSGSKARFIPKRLVDEGECWYVAGWDERGEIRLNSDQIREIRLILPGVNEK